MSRKKLFNIILTKIHFLRRRLNLLHYPSHAVYCIAWSCCVLLGRVSAVNCINWLDRYIKCLRSNVLDSKAQRLGRIGSGNRLANKSIRQIWAPIGPLATMFLYGNATGVGWRRRKNKYRLITSNQTDKMLCHLSCHGALEKGTYYARSIWFLFAFHVNIYMCLLTMHFLVRLHALAPFVRNAYHQW
jgi:hypothetical protein